MGIVDSGNSVKDVGGRGGEEEEPLSEGWKDVCY